MSGSKGGFSNEARSAITRDLREKSLEKKAIKPGDLAQGVIFFPGEAKSARVLRLQLKQQDTDITQTVYLILARCPVQQTITEAFEYMGAATRLPAQDLNRARSPAYVITSGSSGFTLSLQSHQHERRVRPWPHSP